MNETWKRYLIGFTVGVVLMLFIHVQINVIWNIKENTDFATDVTQPAIDTTPFKWMQQQAPLHKPAPVITPPEITLAQYNKIYVGMPFSEVTSMLVATPEIRSQTTHLNGSTFAIYKWTNESPLGYALISVKDGYVASMSQMGLQ